MEERKKKEKYRYRVIAITTLLLSEKEWNLSYANFTFRRYKINIKYLKVIYLNIIP